MAVTTAENIAESRGDIETSCPECDHLSERPRLHEICCGKVLTPDQCNKYRATQLFGRLRPLGSPAKQHNAARPRTDQGKFQGLGDLVAAVTKFTGIDRVVKAVAGKKGCRCKKRQKWLNKLIPFGESNG